MSRTGARPRVLVVGAGLGGTATAIRLLCFARRPLEVVLLERRADYRSAGVAYHRDGNPWEHVFNIQAGRMSLFREDVLDFVRWADREADRRDWPQPWAGTTFVEHGPAPRRIFQDYLAERLAEARKQAYPGVDLVEADGEALDVEAGSSGAEVTVRRLSAHGLDGLRPGPLPGTTTVSADHVVLATGLELARPAFSAEVAGHRSFVRHPYSADGVRRLMELPSEATVAIVGSVLSAYDSAGLLLRRGHTGRIHLISRSGTVFRTYPGGHEHGVLRLPCPATLLAPFRDREDFLARLRTEWDTACAQVAREHPDVSAGVIAERVSKAWEPYAPAVIERIPTPELRSLLTEFSTAIAALRVGAMEYTMAVIERASRARDGSVRLVTGKVSAVTPAPSGRLVVSVEGREGTAAIEADLVVSPFGRESDYAKVRQPLWRNLLRRGVAAPHRRTGRGLEVDGDGTLLDAAGRPVVALSAIGALREGDEIVRNGRTGAFTFNLAAIKNHSVAVAAHVIERCETRADDLAEVSDAEGTCGIYVSKGEEAARPGTEEAVALEVRRLAARARSEREVLDSRLDACLRSLPGRPPLPADAARYDRLLRTAVTRAAVRRLTDVSVTPRELRRRLGLAKADDPEG
ncbi:FAD/NAD(P)-binding protein [Streptomyces sp. NPDC046985]|uniref:FAD/NAD(P)-binding protein n=1 Tax=Streptomyces sp. NPDC046985 TaxID=3155377 RepID=UPI003409B880